MLIATLLIAATPYIGVVESYLYSSGDPTLVSGAFIGPFDSEVACQMAVKVAGDSFDRSANKSITNMEMYVQSTIQCTQNETAQRVFRVVALEPGKYFFSAPYISLKTVDGIHTGLILILPVTQDVCHHTAVSTQEDNPEVAQAICVWPKKGLPSLPESGSVKP